MGEIKSVKVDNWGVFFLQKLQNFFNKTDYCDLTLQFRDNSQLKVHRLVLSACTDYFNVLEQTCEVVDDAIIMPNGLQADVVVPIVNFMYTGTLEFELKMYNRLLRTAKDMNMTVLLKLLEAHRRTMEMHPQKTQTPTSPKPRRKAGPQTVAANLPVSAGGRSLIQPSQNKRLMVGSTVNMNAPQQQQQQQQHRIPPGNTLSRLTSVGTIPIKQQIGSTTFTRIKQENEQETNTPQQGGYTLLKQNPQLQQQFQQQATPSSPFEQLRKGYNNNKRPAVSTFVSPPAKKPNLEDVKEFAEQQRMRKQIAAEYGDDDYDASNIMDDDNIHNDDDDDDMTGAAGQAQQQQMAATSASAGSQTSNQQHQSEDPPGTTTIIVKHEGPDKPPTIVVKDNSNSKMNHAKIISEVLRQYPHLVKSNKNIKLKIMPNAGGQTQKIVVKKETVEGDKSPNAPLPTAMNKLPTLPVKMESQPLKPLVANIETNKPKALQPQQQMLPQNKTNTTTTQSSGNKPQPVIAAAASTTTTSEQAQKRRIDSKTMHALIALGAENTTGPWLCLRCGRNGHPISIPSYRGFRRHLINTHKEIIDPALCEHCGWRSGSKRELHFHMQVEHKVRTNLYIFPECQLCSEMCIDSDGLNQHLIDSHPDENKQQCIYCNKIFPEELQLYTHMKTFHKKQAIEDGIIDYSDDENNHDTLAMPPPEEFDQDMPDEQQQQQQQTEEIEKKVKILSDISLPIASSIIKTDSFSTDNVNIQESSTSGATEEYLHEQDHGETKFVAADGSEVILTDEQRKEILSQLNQEHEGSGVVMVLNEQQQYVGGDQISHDENSQATSATNEEQPEHEEEEEQHDDSHIYSEIKSQASNLEEDSASQTGTAVEAEATHDEQDPEHEEGVGDEHDIEQEHEHEQHQPEHLDESKESVDNLEWAENLISEQDMADEVSQTTTESSKKEEKQEITKEDDNKSQDEISKKLKELTGDWSEDEDEDMAEEEPMPEAQLEKEVKENVEKEEVLKEKETTDDIEMAGPEEEDEDINKIEKEHKIEQEEKEKNETKDDEPKESATTEAEDKEENKETPKLPEPESDNIDEDDIDLALKSLHKENLDAEEEQEGITKKQKQIPEEEEIKTDEKSVVTEKAEKTTEEVKEKIENIEKKGEESKETVSEAKEEEIKSIDEIKAIADSESSSVMEVDEETKKDLIDSLLKEQPETIEDLVDTDTPTTTVKDDIKVEDDSKTTEVDKAKTTTQTESEPAIEDEFLDITPDEKLDTAKEAEIASVVPSTSTTTTAEVVDASSTTTNVTAKGSISSEDQVKSLISEWGDDDEDDDDDTDLTANL